IQKFALDIQFEVDTKIIFLVITNRSSNLDVIVIYLVGRGAVHFYRRIVIFVGVLPVSGEGTYFDPVSGVQTIISIEAHIHHIPILNFSVVQSSQICKNIGLLATIDIKSISSLSQIVERPSCTRFQKSPIYIRPLFDPVSSWF